jgi:hypothetical protein
MKDDWAVVVGVGSYPELDALQGPENDARAMRDWLVSPVGGDVPADHLALILSSDFPAQTKASRAEPTDLRITQAFEDLHEVADDNSETGNGRRVGRRLYIYLSGHGCAPRFNDAALLTANATRTRVGYHVLGKLVADWFLRANYFDEAVLFMDCCRESYPQAPPNIPPWIDVTGAEGIDKARAFYGFGTKWSRLARERTMDDGRVHGVFTWALLEGLKGKAADPDTGEVTAVTLGNYLYNHMKAFLKAEDLQDPDVPKEPDLDYEPNPNKRLLFTTVQVPTFPVTIQVPAAAAGQQVQVLNSRMQPVTGAIAQPPSIQVQLKAGMYLAQILAQGRQASFEVPGAGAINVAL